MILLFALACAPDADEPPLRVLAASSLTEPMTEAAAAFEARTGRPVHLSFDGTSRLAAQLEAGAPADVFVSSDAAWMDRMAAEGLIRPDARVDLFGNRLVVVASDEGVTDPTAVARLGVAGEAVPAGRYARQALGGLGIGEERLVSGDNVRVVLLWVARGELPAGVVYRTDARIEPRVRTIWTFPATSHAPIVYPAAPTSDDPDAAAFLAYLRGEGRRPFEAAGFEVLP